MTTFRDDEGDDDVFVSSTNPLPVTFDSSDLTVTLDPATPMTVTVDGPVTVDGAIPLAVKGSDSTSTGTLTAVGQAVTVDATGCSGYMAMVKGPFTGSIITEGSPDGGTTWIATAWRQSVLGGVGNTFSSTRLVNDVALLRGSAGGFTHYRVRVATLSAGTPTIVLTAHPGTAAVFTNVFIEARTLSQYYTSAAGGRVTFNATTDLVAVSNSNEALVGALVNPTGSGVDIALDVIEIGASAATVQRRYRGRTVTVTGAARPAVNRGGGSNTPVGRLYAAGAFTATGGTVGKVNFLDANSPFHNHVDGTLILRPGESLVWSVDGLANGGFNASLFVDWWEAPAAV